MINRVFRDAILESLNRETDPWPLEEVCPQIAAGLPSAEREGSSMDVLLPICWLIEYNEAVPPEERNTGDRIKVLNAADYSDLLTLGLPDAFYEAIKQDARLDNPSYQFYIKYFKESKFDGRSIVRIGLGLHMTADEINRVLLSYAKQTISWNRVDDLLFRYALCKGWSYSRFQKAYLEYTAYRADLEKNERMPDGQKNADPDAAEKWGGPEHPDDSSYMTRYNKKKLESLLCIPDAPDGDPQIWKMLHESFIRTERAANGAPRRTLAKLSRWAHGDFSLQYASALLGQDDGAMNCFAQCPASKTFIAYQMLTEAAGYASSAGVIRDANAAADAVNRVIRALNDMCGGFKTASHPPLPRGIDHFGGTAYFEDLRLWQTNMLLRPETAADDQTLTLIAECLYRDLPQEYRADARLSVSDGPCRRANVPVIIKAACIALNRSPDEREINRCFENALRRGVFHLLLCCSNSKARRILNMTIRDALLCLGWTDWDGMVSPEIAEKLMDALKDLPWVQNKDLAGSPDPRERPEICTGAMLREILSLISFAGKKEMTKERALTILREADPSDRDAWISQFLDEKMLRALQVLEYTEEQRKEYLSAWDGLSIEEKEYCLFNQLRSQYITERDISESLSMALNIERSANTDDGRMRKQRSARHYIELDKRNSEPSRNLILFIAAVMFGFAVERNERGFTKENCERFISDSIRSAWAASWQLSKSDDQLDETMERLITHALSYFRSIKKGNPSTGLAECWREALKMAGEEYRKECRDAEIRAMMRYKTFHWLKIQLLSTQNDLFSTALMAGQWKYSRETGKRKQKPGDTMLLS